MDLFKDTLRGLVSVLSISASPLYRHPYWSSAEALRGDWGRVCGDITTICHRLDDSDEQE